MMCFRCSLYCLFAAKEMCVGYLSSGVVDVSRKALHYMLSRGKNIQLVVGGQKEMFESRSWEKTICLARKKRLGLFQIAIQHNVGILPIYSFQEPLLMDNLDFPTMQGFFKKYLG